MSMRRFAFAIIALLSLQSCMVARIAEQEPIAPTQTEAIEPGMTAAEVVALMGAPSEVIDLKGRHAYLYKHEVSKTAGTFLLILFFGNLDERSDRVWVFFDRDDRVSHVAATFAAERTEYSFPWEDIYEEEGE